MVDFMHLKVGKGYVTVAIEETDGVVSVGAAFCSPTDQFARRKGRLISTGRLGAGKLFCTIDRDPDRALKAQVGEAVRSALTVLSKEEQAGKEIRWLRDNL